MLITGKIQLFGFVMMMFSPMLLFVSERAFWLFLWIGGILFFTGMVAGLVLRNILIRRATAKLFAKESP